jgi:hypothetical protein
MMKIFFFLVVWPTLVLADSQKVSPDNSEERWLAPIAKNVRGVDIYALPSLVETFSALQPQQLRTDFYCKLTLRYGGQRPIPFELRNLLQSLQVKPIAQRADVRTAVVLLDYQEHELMEVDFSATGKTGYLKGDPVSMDGELFNWISAALRGCGRDYGSNYAK